MSDQSVRSNGRDQVNRLAVRLARSPTRRHARHEIERLKSQAFRDSFDGPQREVSLAPLEPAHVRPVQPELVSECLLAQPALLAVGTQVLAEDALEVAFLQGEKLTDRYS